MVKAAAANGWIDEQADRARDPDGHRPGGRRLRPDVPRARRRPVDRGGRASRVTASTAAKKPARRKKRGGAPPAPQPGQPGPPGPSRSAQLFRRARARMPGGVSSPVRSFASVGGEPFFAVSGRGGRIRDADGRSYVDYVQSYGPHLFGHAPGFVRRAISKAARNGTSFGAPTELEVRLAERVARMVPSVEMVRFVNSGTEAAMIGGAARPGGDGAQAHRQSGGRVSRPRGRVPGRGGLGSRHARHRRKPGSPRRDRRADDARSL